MMKTDLGSMSWPVPDFRAPSRVARLSCGASSGHMVERVRVTPLTSLEFCCCIMRRAVKLQQWPGAQIMNIWLKCLLTSFQADPTIPISVCFRMSLFMYRLVSLCLSAFLHSCVRDMHLQSCCVHLRAHVHVPARQCVSQCSDSVVIV